MSRSYKKTPYCGQRKNKDMKKYANHRVRRLLKNPNTTLYGNDYRKLFETWDICDFCSIQHRGFECYYEESLSRWEHDRNLGRSYYYGSLSVPPTRDEVWQYWIKTYRRK